MFSIDNNSQRVITDRPMSRYKKISLQ